MKTVGCFNMSFKNRDLKNMLYECNNLDLLCFAFQSNILTLLYAGLSLFTAQPIADIR